MARSRRCAQAAPSRPRAAPGSARPPRSAAASPRGRCAAGGRARTARSSRSSDERQVRAALVAAPRRGSRRRSPCARVRSSSRLALGGQQQVERLGRRHQDVRRALAPSPRARRRACRRCARARGSARGSSPRSTAAAAISGERPLEVPLDVVAERLAAARRRPPRVVVGERARGRLAQQAVDADEERRQRLARAGRRGDQRVAPARDRGPAGGLRLGGASGKRRGEPARTAGWNACPGAGREAIRGPV